MSAYRMTQVYVLDKPAGLLEETDAGYRFAYAPTYLASGRQFGYAFEEFFAA